MESDSFSFKTEQLKESNYHALKIRNSPQIFKPYPTTRQYTENMKVLIAESDMSMELLNLFPDEYIALISALDSIDSEGCE